MAGLDWRAMVKDRRFQVAAAVVGGAGVITLIRRKKSGADDTAAGATAGGTGSAASGYQGPGNTTGTDIAGFLSSYSSLLDGRLAEFGANQDEILKNLNAGGSGSGDYLDPFAAFDWKPGAGHTGILGAGADLSYFTSLYWGRKDAAAINYLKGVNFEQISKNGGSLTGLNLIVPPPPPPLKTS